MDYTFSETLGVSRDRATVIVTNIPER